MTQVQADTWETAASLAMKFLAVDKSAQTDIHQDPGIPLTDRDCSVK